MKKSLNQLNGDGDGRGKSPWTERISNRNYSICGTHRKKRQKKTEQSLRDQWDKVKWPNISVTGVAGREEWDWSRKKYLKK